MLGPLEVRTDDGDSAAAVRILREALELWRGPPLLDVAGADFFRAPVARLSELGKTRLSIEAARPLLDRMRDGVWLVELAPLGDGGDVAQAALTAMGVREQALTDR
jgi:hypothetical protein